MSKRIPCKRCSGKGYMYVTYVEGNTGTATSHICPECCGAGVQFAPSTNADRIRAMCDEELKEFICSTLQCEFCKFEGWGGCELLEWLKQPAEEEQK